MKKILICSSLSPKESETLTKFSNSVLIKDAEVEILHCFETQIYAGEYFVSFYPTEEQYPDIEKAILESMEGLKKDYSSASSVKTNCLFSSNPKEEVCNYLGNNQYDLVVVATRGLSGLQGIFNSSFAEYLLRHSPCHVIALRPDAH